MGCLQSRNEKMIQEQQEQCTIQEQQKNNNLDLVEVSVSESDASANNNSTKRVSIDECRNSFNKSIDLMQDINQRLADFSIDDSEQSDDELK